MKNSHSRLSKVIAIVLTLVMLIGIVPVSAATPIGSLTKATEHIQIQLFGPMCLTWI